MKNLGLNYPDGNIAFKVTYVDREWRGVCSDAVADFNINIKKKPWCIKQLDGPDNCRSSKWQDSTLLADEFPCYDCQLLITLEYFSGVAHGPVRDGEPLNSRKAVVGKLAVFTSRKPEHSEKERFVLAIAPISSILPHPDGEYDVFKCEAERAIIFREELRPRFWHSYFNAGNPDAIKWNTGLFRYVSDEIAVDLLQQVLQRGRLPAKTMQKVEQLLQIVGK